MSPRIVCVDTHVLIWGIRKTANADQVSMIIRAESYLKALAEEGALLMIPAVAMAEFLVKVPPEEHSVMIARLGESWIVQPFDNNAAQEYARIWQEWERMKDCGTFPDEESVLSSNRSHLKADIMILASAIVGNAEVIVSHDDLLLKLGPKISGAPYVTEIPDVQKQPDLPLEFS